MSDSPGFRMSDKEKNGHGVGRATIHQIAITHEKIIGQAFIDKGLADDLNLLRQIFVRSRDKAGQGNIGRLSFFRQQWRVVVVDG